jgi:hypothetical protein
VKDKSGDYNHFIEEAMEIGTGGSASHSPTTINNGAQQKSEQNYIKKLEAEIERLKANSGKGRKTPKRQHDRQ